MAKRLLNLDTKDIADILKYIPEGSLVPIRKKLSNAMKTIKPRSAKSKGMALQLDFGRLLAETIGVEFSQVDDDAAISSRTCGLSGSDIILRGEAKRRLPFSYEAKCVENLSLVPAIAQAKTNADADGRGWVLVHRRKALPEDIVIMGLSTYLAMIKKGGY